jgi:hypothetical protein
MGPVYLKLSSVYNPYIVKLSWFLVFQYAHQPPPLGPKDNKPSNSLHPGPQGPTTLSVGLIANCDDLILFLRQLSFYL